MKQIIHSLLFIILLILEFNCIGKQINHDKFKKIISYCIINVDPNLKNHVTDIFYIWKRHCDICREGYNSNCKAANKIRESLYFEKFSHCKKVSQENWLPYIEMNSNTTIKKTVLK